MTKKDMLFAAVIAVVGIVAALLLIQPLAEKSSQKRDAGHQTPLSQLDEGKDAEPDTSTEPQSNDYEHSTAAALATQLEVYFNDKGGYPSSVDFANKQWRAVNFSSFEEELFPAHYTYVVTPADCTTNACEHFTLTVIGDNGEVATRNSLN